MITTISVLDTLLFRGPLCSNVIQTDCETGKFDDRETRWIKQIRLTLHDNCAVNIK